MGKIGLILAASGLLLAIVAAGADDPPPVVPADFKILIGEFSLKKEPISTAEVVVRRGRAYVFPSDSKEVLRIDPVGKRIDLVDIGRKVQAEVTFVELDQSLEKMKKVLASAAEAREKVGGRGPLLEAKMTRDLFQTRLDVVESAGPDGPRIRLTNPAVEVIADGEAEPDSSRLALTAVILSNIARLGAFRVPNDLPPFAELEAIAALTGDRKLRPTRLSYLYRLTGPPRKFHRTYRLVPTLTDREVEAIARVDRLRERIPSLRYERYRANR